MLGEAICSHAHLYGIAAVCAKNRLRSLTRREFATLRFVRMSPLLIGTPSRTRPRLLQVSILVRCDDSGPSLEATVKGFETLEGVEQLHSRLAHGITRFGKLFGVPDGEFDPINSDASLIGHLKFNR
jgi:hypothetical protein